MNAENNELPRGWTTAQLGSFTDVLGGSTPSRNESRYFGGSIVWLTPTEIPKETVSIISDSKEKITEEGFKESGVRWIPEGSVLLTSRASIGYVGIAGTQLTTNQGFASFVLPKGVEPKYLGWWLKSQKNTLEDLARGTTFKEISKATLKDVWAPIAPLAEQHRIVATIEEQFTRLDAGVVALRHAQTKLKRYRAAVLKAAVEGKLTEAWRAEHSTTESAPQLLERILEERRAKWETDLKAKGQDPAKAKYIEPTQPKVEDLPELPTDWRWVTIEAISTKVVDGVHKKPNYVDRGIPFVTVRNLTAGSDISFEQLNYITQEDHIEFCKRAKPERGDILISKDGTLGVVRAIDTDIQFSIFVSVALIKPVIKSMCHFLEIALSSPQVQAQMTPKGSGLQHLHLEDLRIDCIPLPPFAEQQQIVAEVEERLSVLNKLESVIETDLKRAERLRQSILKEAFAGRLVPQDPNDEPASVLLERIRKERDRRKKETASNGRYVHVSNEPVKIDLAGMQQVELWENVGGG